MCVCSVEDQEKKTSGCIPSSVQRRASLLPSIPDVTTARRACLAWKIITPAAPSTSAELQKACAHVLAKCCGCAIPFCQRWRIQVVWFLGWCQKRNPQVPTSTRDTSWALFQLSLEHPILVSNLRNPRPFSRRGDAVFTAMDTRRWCSV